MQGIDIVDLVDLGGGLVRIMVGSTGKMSRSLDWEQDFVVSLLLRVSPVLYACSNMIY